MDGRISLCAFSFTQFMNMARQHLKVLLLNNYVFLTSKNTIHKFCHPWVILRNVSDFDFRSKDSKLYLKCSRKFKLFILVHMKIYTQFILSCLRHVFRMGFYMSALEHYRKIIFSHLFIIVMLERFCDMQHKSQ